MLTRLVGVLLMLGLLAPPAFAQKMSGDNQNIDENGAADVKLKYLLACERLQDSAAKGHCVIVDAANMTVISTTSAVTIGGGVAGDTYLKRIKVLTTLNTACVVTGFSDNAGAAQSFTIPLAVAEHNFGGAKNTAGALTITCSNALDDNQVLVEWWPAS